MARRRAAPDDGLEVVDPVEEFRSDDTDLASEDLTGIGDLADLNDPEFSDWEWTVYRLLTPELQKAVGTRDARSWCARKSGPINLEEIQAELGGGRFEFWGKLNGKLLKRFRRSLEGDPIIRGLKRQESGPAVVQAMAVAPGGDRMMRRLLREMREDRARADRERMEDRHRFETLIATLGRPAPAPPAGPTIGEVVQAVAGIHALGGAGRAEPENGPLEVAKMVLDGFHQGVTLGQEREPIPAGGASDPNSMAPVIEKGLEILSQLLKRAPAPNGRPQRPPSSATVVETPPAPKAESADHRLRSAFELIYRGMLNGKDPGAIAETLEDVLNESELAGMRGTDDYQPTAADLVAYEPLAPYFEKFPGLKNEQGSVYLNSVLAALREPAEG